jgi:uncharacterized protein (TIGR02145 family)
MKKGIRFQLCMILCFVILPSLSAFAQASSDVKIGTQIWTTKNLDATTYRNGDTIRHASTASEWVDAGSKREGAWCYYNHDPKNGAIYGKLYNWYAVNDARGLAPQGYHIPSDLEWSLLAEYLGGDSVAGNKMKSTSRWTNNGNGDNSSGFSGLPGGSCCGLTLENFLFVGAEGHWWSSYEANAGCAKGRYLLSRDDSIFWGSFTKDLGFSIRCLRD